MRELITQIENGLEHDLYLLSLYSALTLPDICGAIGSNNGEATGQKYKEWYSKYVFEKYSLIDADTCYNFRCKALHQSLTESKRPSDDYSFIAFAEPQPKNTGNIVSIQIGKSEIDGKVGPKSIDVVKFILAIIEGTKEWMEEHNGTEPYDLNISKTINRHPEGLTDLIEGVTYIY